MRCGNVGMQPLQIALLVTSVAVVLLQWVVLLEGAGLVKCGVVVLQRLQFEAVAMGWVVAGMSVWPRSARYQVPTQSPRSPVAV